MASDSCDVSRALQGVDAPRLRGPLLGWAACSAAWCQGDPTGHRRIRWCLLLRCNQQGRARGIAGRLYPDRGTRRISCDAAGARRRRRRSGGAGPPGTARGAALPVQWLWAPDGARARRDGAHLARPAVGAAPGHAGLWSAPGPVPRLRDPHGARGVRGPEGAPDASSAAPGGARLSVDADEPRGAAACRELGRRPASGTTLPRAVGRGAAAASPPASRRRRDPPRQGDSTSGRCSRTSSTAR